MHKTLSVAMILTGLIMTGQQAKSLTASGYDEARAEHNKRYAALRAKLEASQVEPSSETEKTRKTFHNYNTAKRIKALKVFCMERILEAELDIVRLNYSNISFPKIQVKRASEYFQ